MFQDVGAERGEKNLCSRNGDCGDTIDSGNADRSEDGGESELHVYERVMDCRVLDEVM